MVRNSRSMHATASVACTRALDGASMGAHKGAINPVPGVDASLQNTKEHIMLITCGLGARSMHMYSKQWEQVGTE